MAILLGFPLLLFVGLITLGWWAIVTVLVTLSSIFLTYHYFLVGKKI
jgi:hypothetical protein